jgi:hypothetical protein
LRIGAQSKLCVGIRNGVGQGLLRIGAQSKASWAAAVLRREAAAS